MIQLFAICKRLTLDPKTKKLNMKGWKKIVQANSH